MGDDDEPDVDIENVFDGVEESQREETEDGDTDGYTPAFENRTDGGAAGSHSTGESQTDSQSTQQTDWTPLIENLNEITELIKEYFKQSRENKKIENEGRKQHFRHQRRIVYTAAGTFLAVVLISAYMTSVDALSGDAFTFVLGTLFGAILTFLQNMVSDEDRSGE